MTENILEIKELTASYENQEVLKGTDISVPIGKILCIDISNCSKARKRKLLLCDEPTSALCQLSRHFCTG
jgi:ABC-type polar amino acid transport system ATPase subunit